MSGNDSNEIPIGTLPFKRGEEIRIYLSEYKDDTFSTPAGDPIREIDLGDPSLGKLELRHLLGRRPEWAQVKNDGNFMSEWQPCPTQSAAGMSSRHGEKLISLFIHAKGPIQKGPIQKRNLPQPKIPDECEATIQAVTRVPYGQKPSPERELLPIVRSDVKRAKWAGGVLLVRNETVAFPPSGETVRDVDLGTGGKAELRHLPDRPPEWLWLSDDATPEAEVWNVCWSAASFGRTSENEIVEVVLHAPGPIQDSLGQASDLGSAEPSSDSCILTEETIVRIPGSGAVVIRPRVS